MELPNVGPYAAKNEGLATPPEGTVLHQMPFDTKYMQDSFWYDTLGRTMIEQRKILTKPRSDEEQVAMVEQALKDCQATEDENTEDGDEDTEEERAEKIKSRIESIALEAGMKGSAAVMRYLVKEHGLNAETSPDNLLVEVHITCENGFPSVLEVLFDEAGGDIEIKHGDATPLYVAAVKGHLETVKWLLDRGAKHVPVEQHPGYVFSAAALSGKVEIMEVLLAVAKDREPEKPAETWVTEGNVLGDAAQSGSLAMMQLVAETGGYGKAAENTEQQRKDAVVAIPLSMRNEQEDQDCLDLAVDCALLKNDDGTFTKSDDQFLIDNLSSAAINCCSRVKPVILDKVLQLLLDTTTLTADSATFKDVLNRALHYCLGPSSEPCARVLLNNWASFHVTTHVTFAYITNPG